MTIHPFRSPAAAGACSTFEAFATFAAFAAFAALAAASPPIQAQSQAAESITIIGRSAVPLGAAGFGDVPLEQSPLQGRVLTSQALAIGNVQSLAAIVKLDPGVSDAYNAEGYWSQLTVRGFVLDNRSNYLRDGLPINAETFLWLGNKDSIEIFKGVSGIQSGTSAPGGLVNLVVKRPRESLRSLTLQWEQGRDGGSTGAQLDLAERFGDARALGLRLNLDATRLSPPTFAAQGHREAWSLAGDARLGSGTLIEAEIESAHRSQPSVPGFSLLGDALPDARSVNPRINLNNQPWSLPVVLDAQAASIRITQEITAQWTAVAHVASQRLKSDDRVAFPFGCTDATSGIYYDHGYCPDGSFDLFDFRSAGERRRTHAAELRLQGTANTGGWLHHLSIGVQQTRRDDSFPPQAYNYVGSGKVDGSVLTPPDPTLYGDAVQTNDRRSEWFARDRVSLADAWELWAGLRHTRLSASDQPSQSFTTPWLAIAWSFARKHLAWLSWGEGVETEVVAADPRYTNAGQALPALRSRQFEAGIRGEAHGFSGSIVAFDIRRPQSADACSGDGTALRCTRVIDGDARHRGIEASIGARGGGWSSELGAMWLDARRQGSATAALNGLQPTNVPQASARWTLAREIATLPGASVLATLVHESRRQVLPDNSLQTPGWSRLDVLATYVHRMGLATLTWRAGIDNLADHRAWREAPYEFNHVYLFPLPPRQARLSLQASY